jgi:hypothetical protein
MYKDWEVVRVAMEVGTGDGGREVSTFIVADLEVLGDGTGGAKDLGHNVYVGADNSKSALKGSSPSRAVI